MHSTIDLWFIKGSRKESLEESLLSYKKDHLLEVAACYGIDLKKRYTKVKMMELLLPVVKEHFQEEWEKTPSIEKEQWLDIESTENVKLQDIRLWIEKGFLFVYLVKGQLKVNIPTELKQVMQETTNIPLTEELDGLVVLYRLAKMMKNIYGFINIHHLIFVWNRYYKSELNEENVIQLLKKKNIL